MREIIDLVEGKQVGLLYHFTGFHNAWRILDDGKLKIGDKEGSFSLMGGTFIQTHGRTHISLTRNPRLVKTASVGGDGEPWGCVRIVLDGDKLAQRNRIEPTIDTAHRIQRQDDQAEERISKDEVDIKGCVVSVDFNIAEYLRLETDWDRWVSPPHEDEQKTYTDQAHSDAEWFVEAIHKLGYKLNVVRKF